MSDRNSCSALEAAHRLFCCWDFQRLLCVYIIQESTKDLKGIYMQVWGLLLSTSSHPGVFPLIVSYSWDFKLSSDSTGKYNYCFLSVQIPAVQCHADCPHGKSHLNIILVHRDSLFQGSNNLRFIPNFGHPVTLNNCFKYFVNNFKLLPAGESAQYELLRLSLPEPRQHWGFLSRGVTWLHLYKKVILATMWRLIVGGQEWR